MARVWAVIALVSLGGAARAAEGESSVTLIPQLATFSLVQGKDTLSGTGALLSLDYQHAVNDTLWLRVSVGGGAYDVDGGPGGAQAGVALVGATYAVDVLKVVPYATAAIGGMYITGDRVNGQFKALVEIGGGLDYLATPRWSIGLDLRFQSFASQANVFTFGPHLSYRWGYF